MLLRIIKIVCIAAVLMLCSHALHAKFPKILWVMPDSLKYSFIRIHPNGNLLLNYGYHSFELDPNNGEITRTLNLIIKGEEYQNDLLTFTLDGLYAVGWGA